MIRAPGIVVLRANLHQFLDEVYILEILVGVRFLDNQDRKDVPVVEVAKQLQLTQCATKGQSMVEGSHLLHGDRIERFGKWCQMTTI